MNIAKYFFLLIEYSWKYYILIKVKNTNNPGLVWDEIAFAKASKFSGRELTSFFVDDLIKIR